MTSTDPGPSPYLLPGGPLQPYNPVQPNSPFPPATSVPVPEFDPPDTEVKLADLEAEAKAAWDLTGRALGGAEGGREAITSSATEFSELISADINIAGTKNEQEWRKACLVLTFAASVADLWRKDVTAFRKERKDLISDYQSAITAARLAHTPVFSPSAGGSGLPLSPSQSPMGLPHDPHAGLRSAYMEVLARFNKKGKDLKDELLDTAGERAALLDGGPEPSNLKALVEAGVLGWGAYNVLGPEHDTPLPVSAGEARKMAGELDAYLSGDKEPDARYYEILAAVGAVSAKAKTLQEANRANMGPSHPMSAASSRQKLDEDELDFLRTFYGELEEQSPYGVVRLMPWLEGHDGPGWGETERNRFGGAMADGLLVLSDEDLGGGQDLLPESVRNFAGGIPTKDGDHVGGRIFANDKHNWLRDARDLGDLFEHADPELRGGTEFSSNTTLALGHYLNQGGRVDGPSPEEATSISHLLDVTTRNEEANHRILTDSATPPWEYSDNPRYEGPSMPDFGSAADALKGLYAHDWEDDGKAVAGLTDWIPEFSRGTSAQAEMAGTATVGLMEALAGEGDDTPFHDAADDSETRHSLAVTEINPELTESLVRIYENYEDDFILHENDTNRYATVSGPEERYLLHEPGDRALHLTNGTKEGFLQLLIADDRTAPIITASVEELERRVINTAVGDPTEGVAGVAGGRVGTIRTLLHDAMINEYTSRYDDSEEAKQHAADNWQTAFNISVAINNGVFGSVPGVGSGLATGGETILRLLEHPQKEEYLERWEKEAEEREEKRRKNDGVDPDYDPMSGFIDSKAQANRHAQLQLLQVYLDRGVVDPQTLKDSSLLPANHDVTAGHVFPAVVESMSQDPGGDFPRLDKVLEEASKKAGANGGNKDWVDDYLADMERSYEPEKYVPKSMKR